MRRGRRGRRVPILDGVWILICRLPAAKGRVLSIVSSRVSALAMVEVSNSAVARTASLGICVVMVRVLLKVRGVGVFLAKRSESFPT